MLLYINHIELGNSSDKIKKNLAYLDPISSEIKDELESLEDAIILNGSKVSNKREIIDKSMQNIEKTVTDALQVFSQRIEMYFSAAQEAHEHFQAKTGE